MLSDDDDDNNVDKNAIPSNVVVNESCEAEKPPRKKSRPSTAVEDSTPVSAQSNPYSVHSRVDGLAPVSASSITLPSNVVNSVPPSNAEASTIARDSDTDVVMSSDEPSRPSETVIAQKRAGKGEYTVKLF